MINLGLVSFLIKVVTDKTINIKLRIGVIISINNFLSDPKLCNLILFEKKILEIFHLLLNEENINENVFQEICFGFMSSFPYCGNESLNKKSILKLRKLIRKLMRITFFIII